MKHSQQGSSAPAQSHALPAGLTHREFKLLLDGSRFNTRPSLHRIRSLVQELAEERPNVTFYPVADLSCHVRVIEFLDTEDGRLRQSHRVLRHRVPQFDGWDDDEVEVAYKVRSQQFDLADDAQLTSTIEGRQQVLFKEEILVGADGALSSLWSRNLVIDTHAAKVPMTGEAVVTSFPDMASVTLERGPHGDRVGVLRVYEVSARLGSLHFGKKVVAHADAAIWRAAEHGDAFVAEVGFQYPIVDGQKASGHQRADEFLRALGRALEAERSTYETKTQAAYAAAALAP